MASAPWDDDPKRSRSRLSADGLDALLRTLDPDRERAGDAYERLRRKLVRLFECRGCPVAEELADETLDRAGQKIAGGQVVRGELGGFVHGIATNVLREWWRRPRPETALAAVERLPLSAEVPLDTTDERRMRAFEACLEALPEAERHLILWYYQFGEKVLIGARRSLAAHLGIGMNALRIRAHRVRARLETCVRGRLTASEIESARDARGGEDEPKP
jgi:DNA-directed RNA polymerase specialized sigma24 family protein